MGSAALRTGRKLQNKNKTKKNNKIKLIITKNKNKICRKTK